MVGDFQSRDNQIPVHLIPFLPLTRDQVRDCLYRQLAQRDQVMKPRQVNTILDQINFVRDSA